VGHGESILRSLRENPYEPEFRDRARRQFRHSLRSQCSYPVGDALMKFMLEETKRDERAFTSRRYLMGTRIGFLEPACCSRLERPDLR
jgi:hypothetical protein